MFGPGRLTARRVVLLWMGSPPHRRNLLAPGWRSLGISARFAPNARGAFGGNPTWVVTLDLGARTNS
jgi:uncharacterized protein YkwD